MGRRTIGQNNGRITQFSDSSTGEVVNYTYDALNRLIAATTGNNTGPVWGESYTYDGFGNLLSKVPTQGTAPQVYTGVNSSTNQMGPADANGNAMWSNPSGLPFAWDVENRMVFAGATDSSGDWVTYSYDPWGKRVLQYATSGGSGGLSTCTLYFYGVNGKRLGTYNCGYAYGQFTITTANVNVYFGKKLIASGSEMNQNAVFTDRLGSVRGQAFGASIAYYPYGEERTSTPDNTDKFGTYFRDGYGQDYADQRYYTSNFGRFWSPDPGGVKTADPSNPTTWNRYAYALGDPTNLFDPSGSMSCFVSDDADDDACSGENDEGDQVPEGMECLDWYDSFCYVLAPAPPSSTPVKFGSTPVSELSGLEASGLIGGYQIGADGSVSIDLSATGFAGLFGTGSLSFSAADAGTIALGGQTITWSISGLGEIILSGVNAALVYVIGSALQQPLGDKDEQCWEQYQADLDICRALKSAACYDQAAQRYAACLTGKPIPPFPFEPPTKAPRPPRAPVPAPRPRTRP